MTNSPGARAFLIFSGLVIGATLATILLLVGANVESAKAREQSKANFQTIKNVEKLLEIVLAVTGCTEEDTPEMCHDKIVAASQEEGQRRIIEVDCRLRRALRGKPAPPPDAPCTP